MTDKVKVLTAADILAASDTSELEEVDCRPYWPGSVYVRQMTAEEFDAFSMTMVNEDGEREVANQRARLAVVVACDADGNLLFTPDQADELGKKHWQPVHRIWQAANQGGGLNKTDEEVAENLSETPGE